MAEIPVETAATVVETAIAVPVVIPVPAGTTIPAVIPTAPVATLIPAAHADPKKADEAATETEIADLPDRIFRISHR